MISHFEVGAVCFLFGLVGGVVLHYLTEYTPLQRRYDHLVNTMVGMKKQGFVPQFEIEQTLPIDISEGVSEY